MGNEATKQGWKKAEQDFLGKKENNLVLVSFDISHSHPDSLPSTVQYPQFLFGLGFNILHNSFNSKIKIFSCSNSKQELPMLN